MKLPKEPYEHGGNIYEVPRMDVLDFSANINPLGMPLAVKRLLRLVSQSVVCYPDPEARRLKAAIARYWEVNEENILVGNGSTELIYLIFHAFRPAVSVFPVPCFTEYERAARIVKSKIRFVRLCAGKDFHLDYGCIPNAEMFLLGNPNNPTGNLLVENRKDIRRIPADRIVVDEAFMDFMPDEQEHTLISEAARSKKVIVLRTLTKIFALPGLRAGYLIAHRDIVRALKEYQMPWSVNGLAQAAGEQCLSEEVFIRRSKQLIAKERAFLYARLSRIQGLRPYSSAVNFLLVEIEDRRLTSACLQERLLYKGILIRDCANFRGLGKQFIRVAVRARKENLRLAQAIKECV